MTGGKRVVSVRPPRRTGRASTVRRVSAAPDRRLFGAPDQDLAEELESRDELLLACREALLGIGTKEAAGLVAHIDALLDLTDDLSPGSAPGRRTPPR